MQDHLNIFKDISYMRLRGAIMLTTDLTFQKILKIFYLEKILF